MRAPLPSDATLTTRARAKINLTLKVIGRRADGYHELESLVAFAAIGDTLTLEPRPELALTLAGPQGAGLPSDNGNLVLRAARALAEEVGSLRAGRFHLVKRLPVASGIGGGSADAAAALRLLAKLNGISADDPLLASVGARIGADVPVCLASRARIMAGVGERLEAILPLPPLFALLVNPGVPVETAAVFRELGLTPGEDHLFSDTNPSSYPSRRGCGAPQNKGWLDETGSRDGGACETAAKLIGNLARAANDLEAPARRVASVIDVVLDALRALPGCRLVRMSGSGATCFALFDDCRQSAAAGRALARTRPGWWIKATVIR